MYKSVAVIVRCFRLALARGHVVTRKAPICQVLGMVLAKPYCVRIELVIRIIPSQSRVQRQASIETHARVPRCVDSGAAAPEYVRGRTVAFGLFVFCHHVYYPRPFCSSSPVVTKIRGHVRTR